MEGEAEGRGLEEEKVVYKVGLQQCVDCLIVWRDNIGIYDDVLFFYFATTKGERGRENSSSPLNGMLIVLMQLGKAKRLHDIQT